MKKKKNVRKRDTIGETPQVYWFMGPAELSLAVVGGRQSELAGKGGPVTVIHTSGAYDVLRLASQSGETFRTPEKYKQIKIIRFFGQRNFNLDFWILFF